MEFTVTDAVDHKPLPPLMHEEKNAIRYIAGYVCRKIHGCLKESSCPERTEIMLCLSDIINGGDIEDEEHTDKWVRKINRGDLWKVTDEVYQLFLMLEQELKPVEALNNKTRKPKSLSSCWEMKTSCFSGVSAPMT